jgi:hypothetical protein
MMSGGDRGLSFKQASREHVLAVTRDFVSQPRISKCGKEYCRFCLDSFVTC